MPRFVVPFVLVSLWFSAGSGRADFALRDGDVVVFLGDSITAARTYGKIIENYSLLRYPQRRVRFINAGRGGDTAAGGLARLKKDVFAHGATVLTVAYGVNDIGWGLWADDEHKQKYLDAIRGIVKECKKRGVRVFICSAAVTGADPHTSEDHFLQKMCDEGMAISRALGEGAIDVQRTMRKIQKKIWAANQKAKSEKQKATMHAADTIHLSELGQLAMAFAILKGLGAPAEVSSVAVDAKRGRLLSADGCRVTDLSTTSNRLEFTRHDEGLPINFGTFAAFNFRFVPVPDELNRYMLTIADLPPGRYDVLVNNRLVGAFSSRQFAAGLNLASHRPNVWQPGGPWDAQATILSKLTDARSDLAVADLFNDSYLSEHSNQASVSDQASVLNAHIEELQRALVRPSPFRFVVRPAETK